MSRARQLVSPQNTAFYRLRWWAAATALLAVIGAALSLNAAHDDGLPEVLAHRVSLHPQNSLIAEVRITLSDPAQVFIEYENPEAGKFRTALSQPGTEHTIPVVRLRPATAYAYTIGLQAGPGGRAYGPSGEFTTGWLPLELAGMQSRAAGRSSQPLIVTDYKNRTGSWYFFWDETGSIVWYYMIEDLENLSVGWRNAAIKQKPNGNLVYISHLCCLVEITPLGEVVDWLAPHRRQGKPHHDFRLLDDGRILYLAQERAAVGAPVHGWPPDTIVKTDRLHSWNPADASIEEVWDSRDFWDISDPGQWMRQDESIDYLHLNSLSVGADGNLIVSARTRNQIFALAPDFRRVEWQLGGPGSDYEFPNPGDRFYGPHSAAQLPNGHLLLFDNGWGRPDSEGGEYSRALELRLDEANGTAVKAWEYRHQPDIYSRILSSAFRLNSGHTLVNFGINEAADEVSPMVFVEVNRPGLEVFRVETYGLHTADRSDNDFPRRFRATADITSIMGETMLRPPAERPAQGRPRPGWPAQALAAAQQAALQPFDLRIDGRRLVYRKQPCVPEETAFTFWLHLYPANPGDLPEERREYGFDNRDFRFWEWGVSEGRECEASVPLPDYPIARIRTGQHLPGGERLWEVEIPGPESAAPPPAAP